MLVMIKAILYERTVAVGKVWEDLSLEVTAGGLGEGRRLWRQESVFKTFRKKNYELDLLYEKPENWDLN